MWRNTLTGIDVLSADQWQPIAKKVGISLTRSTEQLNQSCPFQYSNLCIEPRRTNVLWWQSGMISLCVIILGLLFRLGLERRREMKERQFILQLLTHELRTPITSLGFTVEQFRDEYDHLNEHSQHAFYRLLGDYQRLYRLTETSKGFLSGRQEAGINTQDALFSEWLESITSPYDVQCRIDGDCMVSLPYYWLGVCLDNLLRNAVLHGKPPISLHARISGRVLIEVKDQGISPALWKKWLLTEKGQGMGIGLMIVKRIMRRIGGRLTHLRHPTRYILELPL
ncbi:ATP-binding protein [Photobacterium sp. Hal280]|uniref:ATP-binding protein n=1 Tax=Photobacterium sp. Hal280 TaxID=3035163 RepID=UPI00301E2E42